MGNLNVNIFIQIAYYKEKLSEEALKSFKRCTQSDIVSPTDL